MNDAADGLILSVDALPVERFDDPARGNAHWHTLFSGDRTPTRALSAGVMVLPSDGRLEPHRHAQVEVYYVLDGAGMVTLNGIETRIAAGDAVYIPGDAVHAVWNNGVVELRIFYVFAADRFSEVIYPRVVRARLEVSRSSPG